MRKIEIIVRPFKVDDVKDAISALGLKGMTVTDVKGFGRQGGHKEVYRGAEYQVDFIAKTKVEIVVDADRVSEVIEAVSAAAKTGKVGDGKIFVIPVEEVVRIRTGETGPDAI
ncbi:P-II family nitrogen regulator [Maridesulfovibrio salexigens]|uniref:Nitrogen regulatory protein P-II n=1 Tax=Maridesulfovibrio salexigens (strain ATCC 14822 / DSM 2638 / NCIMB 8403 / VKM B-1763) TaxID=526222 RepID=C6BSM9_MARSD|nr:P-II family nitrogen regulator [Maridesulfovibrio salexigens]ACS81485.1 nitrogen regulatory protein P-II [Maridesulfovibrio salexigens DSM 2638]